ncbi:acetyl-CoA synthetase-like protein [Dipodascopsis uninucleata]
MLLTSSSSSNKLDQVHYSDLLSFVFEERTHYDESTSLYMNTQIPLWKFRFKDVLTLVRRIVAGLKARGVRSGDKVLLFIANDALYTAIVFGIIGAGGVFVGANPSSQSAEVKHILNVVQPKFVITNDTTSPAISAECTKSGITENQIFNIGAKCLQEIAQIVGHDMKECLMVSTGRAAESRMKSNFSELLQYGESDWERLVGINAAKSTVSAMFMTSGTGGLSKGALLSHHAIIEQHRAIRHEAPYQAVRLISLPMFHLFGALWTHIFPIKYGEPLYIMSRFSLARFTEIISQFKVTETYMVPPMIHAFNSSHLSIAQALRSLQYVGVAGTMIGEDALEKFQGLLHEEGHVAQLWGMTEVGVVFQNRAGEENDFASIGKLLKGYEVKMVTEDGTIVKEDDVSGELYVRGDGLLMKYEGATESIDGEGWFPTGDIMFKKDDKYFIAGRTKELIKVRGWQVAPAEIEAVLLRCNGVADVAVVGVTCRTEGIQQELPKAFVVRELNAAGRLLTKCEIYNYVRNQLASYKALDGGVEFVNYIPRTVSGKTQRFKLA